MGKQRPRAASCNCPKVAHPLTACYLSYALSDNLRHLPNGWKPNRQAPSSYHPTLRYNAPTKPQSPPTPNEQQRDIASCTMDLSQPLMIPTRATTFYLEAPH
jgi:hypothetical protein